MLQIDEAGRGAAARTICAEHPPLLLESILTWCDPLLRPAIEKRLLQIRARAARAT